MVPFLPTCFSDHGEVLLLLCLGLGLRLECLASKVWQDKRSPVDVLVVIPTQALLLLTCPLAERLAHVTLGILAAHHEADLAGRVGGDGGIGVFDDGKDLGDVFLKLANQSEVEPLVLG